ncbi:MAG: amidohydrolase family protein [Candidatus Thermoplasmatota archaeon]|jgi:guanine deaminase|nr:amidohydrolase family protein [Candidatus Thermoplasmatota archaeon]
MRQGQYLLRGDILFPEGTVEGSITVIDGAITNVALEELEEPVDGLTLVEGLIVPGLLDMHSHLGDHDARGDLPVSIKEAFFPGGTKHRFLEGLDDVSLIGSIRAALDEVSPGVDTVIDFREGGVRGMKALLEASRHSTTRVLGFGRPVPEEGTGPLLDIAQGLGMPSLESCGEGLRKAARERGIPFALHASELYREEVGDILDLDPELVVHMVSGTRNDWRDLADADIPVAVCPRASLAFGLPLDLKGMLEAGLALGLGTDNAMTVRQDIFRDMECAWSLLHRAGFSGTDASKLVLDMAAGRSLTGTRLKCMVEGIGEWGSSEWLSTGTRASLMVLHGPKKGCRSDPWSWVVRFSGQDRVIW